jgi:Flp pilus assembly protein TadG
MPRHLSERGQVLPMVAICLAVLMGFGAMSIDAGYLEYHQRQQQNAADAAAIGGAQQLVYDGCGDSSAANAAALTDAANAGFANGGNVMVTPNNPPKTGPYANNSCAVQVSITNQHTQTFLSRVFGWGNGMAETTQATAEVTAARPTSPGLILTSTTTTQNFSGAQVSAPYGIAINGSANFDNASITAPSIGYAGSASETGAKFGNARPSQMLPMADPCLEIAGCAYLANNPPSTTNCQTYTGSHGTVPAGCYNSLNLSNANVTLSGTYVLNGTSNFNGATLTGDGVTIYVTANGTPPDFNGAMISLSAPSSGDTTGVLYYQVPSNTGNANFNGGCMPNISGLIYATGSTGLKVNGSGSGGPSGGGYVPIIAGGVDLSGNPSSFGPPPSTGSLFHQAVLVQ